MMIAAPMLLHGTAQSAERVVLAENFTATWCGYCPAVSNGLLQVLTDNPDRIVGFQVHGSDAYTCAWGNSRLSFYGVSGFPTIKMDGWWSQVGSYGSVNANANNLTNGMNACLNRTTDVTIDALGEELSDSEYKINWEVAVEDGGTAKTVRLYCVQALDLWPAGSTHYFNCVIQHQAEQVITLSPGVPQTFEHTFTLSGASLSNTDQVRYFAWVQDVANSGPAQVHNVKVHVHGELPAFDVTVGGSGSDYPTITEAINNVGDMSTISVNPGTYYENIDFGGKNMKLIASGSPEDTIINGGGNDRVITLLGGQDENTEISGFTLTNGDGPGAGIGCNGTPIISNCIIGNNTSDQVVAGLMAVGTAGPTVTNVDFCNNTVNDVDGMHIYGTYVDGGGNTFADECDFAAPCDGDFDANESVDVNDLLTVIAGWQNPYDVNDLLNVIANWGDDCG
jgi:thiol-disulfide isomerase/thioredoxin